MENVQNSIKSWGSWWFRVTEISDLWTPLFPEGSITLRFYCSCAIVYNCVVWFYEVIKYFEVLQVTLWLWSHYQLCKQWISLILWTEHAKQEEKMQPKCASLRELHFRRVPDHGCYTRPHKSIWTGSVKLCSPTVLFNPMSACVFHIVEHTESCSSYCHSGSPVIINDCMQVCHHDDVIFIA